MDCLSEVEPTEYIIEIVLFPGGETILVDEQLVMMIILGEIIRKTTIITTDPSPIRRKEHHKLGTEGVYQVVRHPRGFSFGLWERRRCSVIPFWQIVVWRFFTERIP
ncbi:LOW QUALITY PROTEIN: hypothetical protein HID58_089565 [Brassica napus]|uniref:Uncharacterized protein n=1 Tax=Brassica napus TaxID=3708 RepID=A0ABQ7XZE0_BRANA|nr:LOW QUALITY PROTEIN: hypothetical protein HID58_089565 [Brassica napus]